MDPTFLGCFANVSLKTTPSNNRQHSSLASYRSKSCKLQRKLNAFEQWFCWLLKKLIMEALDVFDAKWNALALGLDSILFVCCTVVYAIDDLAIQMQNEAFDVLMQQRMNSHEEKDISLHKRCSTLTTFSRIEQRWNNRMERETTATDEWIDYKYDISGSHFQKDGYYYGFHNNSAHVKCFSFMMITTSFNLMPICLYKAIER